MISVPKLRELRHKAGLEQEALARAANVARGTIHRAESGYEVRPATARRLAKALRVRPSDLMAATDSIEQEPRR